MFSWLKKHFIPHVGNEHRPHFLRDTTTRHILAVILILEVFAFLVPALFNLNLKGGMALVLPTVLSDLTNEKRAEVNLPALKENAMLTLAAQMKAEDMATKGYFAHTSPEGRTPWYWLETAGYKYQYAGENLAVNFRDSEDVTAAWMKSPTHKANIVKGNYTEIGTGIAEGIYKGKKTVYVAQVYANPMPQFIPKPAAPKPEPAKVAVTPTPKAPEVLGAEAEAPAPTPSVQIGSTPEPELWQELVASPRNTTNFILAGIAMLTAIALLLYIVLKVREHHRDLLGNGLAVLAVIGAVLVLNYSLSLNNMVIAKSLDYSIDTAY